MKHFSKNCHLMSSCRCHFVMVGCMDESVTSNTFCLSQCVAGYYPIDQSTGRCCPTSTFVVFHGFSLLPRWLVGVNFSMGLLI